MTRKSFWLTKRKKGKKCAGKSERRMDKDCKGCREEEEDQNIGKPPEKEREQIVMACFSGEEWSQTTFIRNKCKHFHSHSET